MVADSGVTSVSAGVDSCQFPPAPEVPRDQTDLPCQSASLLILAIHPTNDFLFFDFFSLFEPKLLYSSFSNPAVGPVVVWSGLAVISISATIRKRRNRLKRRKILIDFLFFDFCTGAFPDWTVPTTKSDMDQTGNVAARTSDSLLLLRTWSCPTWLSLNLANPGRKRPIFVSVSLLPDSLRLLGATRQ